MNRFLDVFLIIKMIQQVETSLLLMSRRFLSLKTSEDIA